MKVNLKAKGAKGVKPEGRANEVERHKARPDARASVAGSGQKKSQQPQRAQKPQQPTKASKPRDEVMAFIDRAVRTPPPSTRERPTDTPPASTYRIFFALRVPTEISAKLAETQRKLKGNWRSVRPDQMHVTLCYLPAVPPERLEDLKRLGTSLMQDLPPMAVKLRGTGYFPNEGSPRVWFVKVEAAGLDELAQAVRAGVRDMGLETDDLPFKAHITLARKKGPAPRVPPILFETSWTATGGTLYRSHLRKTGPIYEVESTFRFRGAPPLSPSPPVPHEIPFSPTGEASTDLETKPETQDIKEQRP